MKNAPELEKPIRSVFNDMSGFIKAFPYAVNWVCSLKESGLKVFCLSNISDKICDDCADELEFLKYTDGKILSYEERLIKPDLEIYKRLLDRYRLCANECIFVDDIEQNVTAAEALGIHGIVFYNKIQAENEIEMIRRLQI